MKTEREGREKARSNKLERRQRGEKGRGREKKVTRLSMDPTSTLVPPSLHPHLWLNDDLVGSSTVSPLQQGHHLPSSLSSLLRRSDRKDGNDDDRGSDDGWFGLLLHLLGTSSEKEGRESRGGGCGGGGVGSRSGEGEGRSG